MGTAVKIDHLAEGFVRAHWAAFELVMKEKNGFFEVSALSLGDKGWAGYSRQPRCQLLTSTLRSRHKKAVEEVHQITSAPPRVAGTYCHLAVLLDFALWLSPELYVRSAVVVSEVLAADKYAPLRQSNLFAHQGLNFCHHLLAWRAPSESLWSVVLGKLKVVVDERGWFDGDILCSRSLRQFAEQPQYAPLVAYLWRWAPLDERYCHPLLALCVAAWLDSEAYLECAYLVFGYWHDWVTALIRRAIKEVGTWADSTDEVQREVVADRRSPLNQSMDDDDDDAHCFQPVPDVTCVLDSSPETDRTPNKVEISARKLRWLLEEVERERAKKAKVQQRVHELEAQLQSTKAELEAQLQSMKAELRRRKAELRHKKDAYNKQLICRLERDEPSTTHTWGGAERISLRSRERHYFMRSWSERAPFIWPKELE